jgi:hypothetical protein
MEVNIMGKINMNKAKETTINSAEIEELTEVKPAEAPIESTESTDNTNTSHEDTNEIEQEKGEETKPEPNSTVIVRYIGGGVWIDEKGNYWANEDKSDNILHERQYSKAEYESREDIQFMVSYGAMKIITVGK